jgi:site-specific recombinase XerC
MTELTPHKKTQIINQISDFLDSKSLDKLNENELEYITKQILVDRLKDELKTEIKMSKVDLDALQDRWLSGFDSSATKETYGKSLQIFIDWLEVQSLNLFNLNSIDIDDYVSYIRKQYNMNNSIRERIAAVSSFFSFLERHDIISKNYFKGCRRPPRPFETKDSGDIPDEAELGIIEQYLQEELNCQGRGSAGKRNQARILLAVVTAIKHHGLRCGALPSFSIDKTGRYRAESKGKEIKGRMNEDAAAILKKLGFDKSKPFKELKVNSIQKGFERFCKRLYAEGKIKTVYSLHDLRHYAAVKHYEEDKDIISTQRYLGHGSVSITQGYLASLNCGD